MHELEKTMGKKKKQKASIGQVSRRKEKEIKKCMHGAFMAAEEIERRIGACNDYIERHEKLYEEVCLRHGKNSASVRREVLNPGDSPCHVLEELKHAQLKLWNSFWAVHADLVDDRLEKVIIASAAESLLDGDSRRAMVTANILFLLMGRHPYYCKGKGPNDNGINSMLFTYRGMVLFVTKRMPCSCLAELRREAKRSDKTDLCCRCFSTSRKDKLFVCARCKRVSYCSEECQRTDWNEEHRDECESLANVEEKEQGSVKREV